MTLPNADRAVIDPAKIRDYLLAAAHPVGRFKARFFVSLATLQINESGFKTTFWPLPGQERSLVRRQHLRAQIRGR